ncbi:hypothetical protein ABW20_dc0104176 [Dactylellina cionopaga]|nr:hypothetical protein ABW20_dc0104176 [Dactylellina cionopaga]
MSSTTDTRSRKRELRKLNQLIWDGRTDVFAVKPPLDTSFKKNTAVIKKFRTSLTPENTPSLLKDIATVSLEKYLPEVISAVSEGLLKAKVVGEISTAIEIVSALHQRFGKAFTPFIVWNIAKGLSTPGKEQLRNLPADQREKEESARLARQRVLLRVATELWLVGVVRTLEDAVNPDDTTAATAGSKSTDNVKKQTSTIIAKSGDDEPLPLEALKDILSRDREGTSLSLVVLFIKNFAWDVLGVKARATSRKAGAEDKTGEDGATQNTEGALPSQMNGNGTTDPTDQPLTDPSVQVRFRNILTTYFSAVGKYIHNEHRRLHQQAKRNSEAYVRSGEVFEDRQQAFEKATKAHEKLVANAQTVAEALGLEMPDLSDEDEAKEVGEGMIRESGSMFKKGEEVSGNGMWEDEDQRRFYEDLIDLRSRVPSILLDEGRKATSGTSEKKEDEGSKETAETIDEEVTTKAADLDLGADAVDRDTTIANKTVGAQVDALLIRLPELTNRDLIDSFAYDFCFLNSKASRNRLIKVLEDIPKGRSDLLPYYARLIASLSRAGLADIAAAMVSYLDKEFRSLQRRKEKEQLTSIRTQLETLQRKKDAHHLSAQDRISIENAFYYVNPPERPSIAAKERSPSELYVRKLIYLDLNKKNYNKTIKSLRKLHWEDPNIVHMLVKVCTKIWKVRYSNVFLIAILVFGLFRYHQDFGIRVVDGVLENIRVGLEENDYRMNQRRIATIKYLGELYNYKMIDSPVIFDTLYLILSFGYEGSPRPGVYNPLDPPDNHFRIRLVCTILDTCGECFDRGSSKKKLDFFLAFFQYYIHLKERVPMDIEFMIQDTFQLVRPNWVLHTTLEEAGKAFQEAAAKIYGPAEAADDDSSTTEDAAGSDAEDDEIKLSDDDMDVEAEGATGKEQNHENGAGDDEDSDSEDDSSESGDMDDEGIVYSRPQEQRDPEAEADFDREFAKLMAESLESRKFERKTVFDVPLPIKKSANVPTAQPTGVITMSMLEEEEEEAPPPQRPGIMTFALLTKKGNKQQTREIELPSDSTFAVAMKSKQEAEREERQRIKDRVLHYERMEEEPVPLEPQRPNTNGSNLKYGDKNKSARGKKLQLGDFNWYDENPNHKNNMLHTSNYHQQTRRTQSICSSLVDADSCCLLSSSSATARNGGDTCLLSTADPSLQQTKESIGEQASQNHNGNNHDISPHDTAIYVPRAINSMPMFNQDVRSARGSNEASQAVNRRKALTPASQRGHSNLPNHGPAVVTSASQPKKNMNPQKNYNYNNSHDNRGNRSGGHNSNNQLTIGRGVNHTGPNRYAPRSHGNGTFQRQQQSRKDTRNGSGNANTENHCPSPGHLRYSEFVRSMEAKKGGVPAPVALTLAATPLPPPPPPAMNEGLWPELGKK